MKSKQIAAITALIFASIVLLFQFLRISIIGGELNIVTQSPILISEADSALTIIETAISLTMPTLLVIFCILLVKEICRKNPSLTRVRRTHRLLVIPLLVLVISAIQKTLYIFAYEGSFSLKFTWVELLTSTVLLTVYYLTVKRKLKFSYWIMGACFIFIMFEVCRLCLPGFSYTYIIGINIYISTFISAVIFYLTYIFIELSRKE